MRVPEDQPRRARRRGRTRIWIIAGVLIAAVFLLLSLQGIAGFYTDKLWFDSLGYGETWRRLLAAKVVPAAVFTAVFFVIVYANLLIADRLAPTYAALAPGDEFIERYQRSTARYAGRIRLAVALFFALVVGVGVSAQWQQWILFTNRVDFGVKDPEFGMDVGFYVFQLPFLQFIFNWLFASFFILLFIVALAHYLNGGIRFQGPFQRVTPQVKAHLSVILAVMALIMAVRYYFDRFSLTLSGSGVVDGATATDVSARLPALNLLVVISIVAALLFIVNIVRRGWVLPVIAVGLSLFVALIVGTIYPAYYERFRVNPNELARERPYITRNIEATRAAYGLEMVEEEGYEYEPVLDVETIDRNRVSIDNARLWDPDVTQRTYQTLQGLQTYYRIDDVDVDRYMVDGRLTPTVIAARELNREQLPSQTWVNRHIVYTHGYGLVSSPSNVATDNGNPAYLSSDIPTVDTGVEIDVPELYFGEALGGYALVNAKQDEFNYPTESGEDVTTRYEGSDGVSVSSWIRRAAFALRFGDINPLISSEITSETKIVYLRDIRDRITQLAPFLEWDDDPYPIVSGGDVHWVLDGYTTTGSYPYAQSFSGPGGLAGDFNYVRNSVKATIDAYDGTVTLYVMDDEDPIIRAYSKAFPGLFTDLDEMPTGVREHLRYPEDMFTVQADMYGSYHVQDATTFYQQNAKWLRSPDPNTGGLTVPIGEEVAAAEDEVDEGAAPQAATSTSPRMEPYYLLVRPPGAATEEFVIVQPFVPVSAENRQTRLSSFLVASGDPANYGELRSFVMPDGQTVLGPAQVANEINTNAEIAEQLTLLSRGGTLLQGSLQLIPVGDSILYVRPIYLQGETGSAFPTFRFVAVFAQGQPPVLTTTVDEALELLFDIPSAEPPGGEVPSDEDPDAPQDPDAPEDPDAPQDPVDRTVDEMLEEIVRLYDEAEQARLRGEFDEYYRLITELGALIDELRGVAATEEPADSG